MRKMQNPASQKAPGKTQGLLTDAAALLTHAVLQWLFAD